MADQKPAMGESRRRWQAVFQDGSLAGLRSEGRLVACYVFLKVDWSSCEVRFSMRHAAKFMQVQPTTVRRGVSQMLEAGILEILEKPDGRGWTRYVVPERAQAVSTPDTSGAQGCAQAVSTPDTTRAQSAHEPCAVRARVVRRPRTLCARNTVLPTGSPVTTSGVSSPSQADGGAEPATAGTVSRGSGESAGLTGVAQPRQEDVA